MCGGNDGIERVTPDDEDAFIADEGSVLVPFCLREKDRGVKLCRLTVCVAFTSQNKGAHICDLRVGITVLRGIS
jgi:hypothetical protein